MILCQEGGEWYGHGLELPDVMADGSTVGVCVKKTREALTTAVATMMELGRTVPIPANEGRRTEQINVRLSIIEKVLLQTFARTHGYRGVGDCLRSTALAAVK